MSDIDTLIARLTERQQMEFALACARRVQRLMRDPRSVAALDTRARWLRGEAKDHEMEKAWAAADAAWTAAWTADYAYAAFAAARAAAADASDAAWAAARAAAFDAERAWQREELERMLRGGGA